MDADFKAPTTLEEILENPNAFNLPTFEQYSADPDKYKLAKDIWFQKIDEGSQNLADVRKHKYKVKTKAGIEYKCESLAHVERIAKDEGFGIDQLKVKPEVRQSETTGYYIEVLFECPQIIEEI